MRGWAWSILLLLTACGSGDDGKSDASASPHVIGFISDTATDTADSVWKTVQAPFEDVGLKQDEIPEQLQRTEINPYAMPNPLRCDLLQKEIAELDILLGPDVCTIADPKGTGTYSSDYLDQGSGLLHDQAGERAKSLVGSQLTLPFRSVVRRVSGADKHAKEVAKAYQYGKLRRAFLKGVGMTLTPPCHPLPPPPPVDPAIT